RTNSRRKSSTRGQILKVPETLFSFSPRISRRASPRHNQIACSNRNEKGGGNDSEPDGAEKAVTLQSNPWLSRSLPGPALQRRASVSKERSGDRLCAEPRVFSLRRGSDFC